MTEIITNIQEKAEALAEICRRFHVARLELFGSACTAEFDPRRSDFDFLVEFLPGTELGPWLTRLFELRMALSQSYNRTVDLTMASALRDPWFRREAEKTRTTLDNASQDSAVAS